MKRKHCVTVPAPLLRRVLVLQHEHAYWFKIIDGRITDRYVEELERQQSETAVHCPWSQSTDDTLKGVELILDSTLDEVNRIGVSQSSSVLINCYRRWMTLGRARRDYPRARVYSLPAGYQEQVAAIMHSIIPEQWSPWLLALQANHVVFHHVSVGNELLERWSRRFDGKVLLLMSSDRNQRHLLVERGATVFLRSVPTPTPETETETETVEASKIDTDNDELDALSLLKNMKHLFEHDLSNGKAVLFVKPVDRADQLNDLDAVQTTMRNTSVECLVAMHLGAPVAYHLSEWRGKGLVLLESPMISDRADKADKVVLAEYVSRYKKLRWFKDSGAFWLTSRSTLRRFSALAPSVSYLRISRRRAVTFQLSLVLAGVACVTAVLSIANGIAGRGVAERADMQRLQVERSKSLVKASADKLFSNPVFIASSLSLSDQLTSPKLTLAESLLTAVATALMVVPDVSLDQLVWVRIEDDEVYESLGNALEGVSHRQRIEVTVNKVDLQLEISGSVSGAELAHQKSQLDEFVGQLSRLDGVMDISLLESPVDSALSSDNGNDQAGRYRLSVRLGGRR